MNIYSELFFKVLQILSEPLKEIANPSFWVFFFLLPVIAFFISVRVLKPKRLIFRILLPIPIVILIALAGIILMQQVSGGFFGLMFVAEIFLITFLSLIVVIPCCGGMVLRGREKLYSLIPISCVYFAFSFSHVGTGDFTEDAIPLLILVPIFHSFFLWVGTLIGGHFIPASEHKQKNLTPFLKDRGPLIALVFFLVAWGLLFFDTSRVFSRAVVYGTKTDQEMTELKQLQPPPLFIFHAPSGGGREWNEAYSVGKSPFLVEKFDFAKQNYEPFATVKIDLRPGGAGVGTLSPEGNKIAAFHNGNLEVFNADGDVIASYTTATSGIISWSPNAKRILLYSCERFADGCTKYSVVDLAKNTIKNLNINAKEVYWVNDENIITVTRGALKLSVFNVVEESAQDLPSAFNTRYRVAIPSPDLKLIVGITPEGKIEICDESGNVLSRPELKDLITGALGPYYFLQWSPSGKFFGIGRQGTYGNVGLSSIVTRDGRAFNTPLYGQPREPIRGFWAVAATTTISQ